MVAPGLADQAAGVGAVSRIDATELDLLRPTHINETLARVPGTWVSRGSGQEHLTAIRSGVLTGAGACGEFLYLEDGLPIRPAGFCNINNLFEVNHEQAAAIEVLRGPAGALFGGNALHGVINVAQQPVEPGARVSIEGGTYDYYQVRGAWAGQIGAHSLAVHGLGSSSNGYRDDTGYGQQKLYVSHATDVGRWSVRNSLSATLLNQETGGFVLGFEAFKDPQLQRSNPNPEAYRDAWSVRLSSRWRTQLTDGPLAGAQLDITPYARRSAMEFLQHFLPGQPTENNDQTSAGVMATLARNSGPWQARAGAQIEFMGGSLREFQDGPTVGSAFLVATRPQGLHYDYDVDSVMAALFYHVSYRFDERLELVQSARLETLKYDYDNNTLTGNTRDDGTTCGFGGCLYTRPPSGSDRFTNAAGRLGINYRLADWRGAPLTTYAAISTGFRPPQATELYRLQNGQTLADLDSERLLSLEVGARWRGGTVALYSDRTRDFILRDADGFNISNGKTRSQGLEVSWQFGAGSAHEFDLVASYGRHKYDFTGTIGREPIEDGNDVDTAPRWLGSARWRYQPREHLVSELELVGVGQHYVNAANTADYDGHVLVNWRGSYRVRDNLRVFARLVNFLDEEYAERADFAFGNFRYFPGMPRQLYLGLEFQPR